MRNLRVLDQWRVVVPGCGRGDETCGCFQMMCVATGGRLLIVASSGHGWDHVSVSLKHRIS
jgi:hypothetical protein